MNKKHDYLNLGIGGIEQYCMVVADSTLDYWRNLGWLTFTEVELPKGDEEAWMLYGDVEKNETLIFNKPTLSRDNTLSKIINLQVLGFSSHLGTYGMGGPGFFGLFLNNSEILTYAVWSAGEYVIIDGRVVECDSNLYSKVKPWFSNTVSNGKKHDWDDLTNHISGSIIIDISLNHDTCTLILEKQCEPIEMLFVRNDSRLPRKSGRKRNAYNKGDISEYILFQHERVTLIL